MDTVDPDDISREDNASMTHLVKMASFIEQQTVTR